MKRIQLKIGGRTFSLAFTLDAMCELQELIPDFNLAALSDYVKTPAGLRDMIVALARQGELLEGRVLDVDAAWFGSHISPSPRRIATIQVAVLEALSIGMTMETDDGEDREVDVALEDIKKNGPTAASHGGSSSPTA